jgi:hypothetical protein
VEPRPVVVGALFGELRSIVSGVTVDDRIIINGQMHARPGAVVAPNEVPLNVDPKFFSDPGPTVAQGVSASAASAPEDAAISSQSGSAATQPAGGITQ